VVITSLALEKELMIIGSHVQAKVQAKLVLFDLYIFPSLIEGFPVEFDKSIFNQCLWVLLLFGER
jgi:hypothetical protein